MENKILSSKYFAPLAIGMISLIVFLNNYEYIHPIVKYLFLLFSLVLSFYYNPFAIVKVVTDKSMSDIKEKVMYAISFVILSTISAYLFILMFTTSENVLLFGKILGICNGIFAMALYFVEKTRSHLLLIHLLLVFIFTTLIQIL